MTYLDRQLTFTEANLREQLVSKDAEVSARDAELVGVREQAELERVRLEGLLSEERTKSEYLFAEAGVLREQLVSKDAEVSARDAELVQLSRQLSAMDRELASVSITSLKNQHAASLLPTLLTENQTLSDALAWTARDIKRLTGSRLYLLRRKIRLAIAIVCSFKRKGVGIKRDVIPIDVEPAEYVNVIRSSGFTEEKLLKLRRDLQTLEINPFSHYVMRGHTEQNHSAEI
jgi:hypothetical protein